MKFGLAFNVSLIGLAFNGVYVYAFHCVFSSGFVLPFVLLLNKYVLYRLFIFL